MAIIRVEISNLTSLQALAIGLTDWDPDDGNTYEYHLVNDIDCKLTQDPNYGVDGSCPLGLNLGNTAGAGNEGWVSIADTTNKFNADFHGNGFAITGLKCNRSENWEANLFGSVDTGCTISNVRVLDFEFIGATGASGLIGYAYFCFIKNCEVQGTISGASNAGGMLGYANGCIISDSKAEVDLDSCVSNTGGFIGWAKDDAIITRCIALGDVDGASGMAGFVGLASDCTISDCYSNGDAIGSTSSAGFIGRNVSGTFVRCYATGLVDSPTYFGGFCGKNEGGSYADCFYDQVATGQNDNDGRGIPLLDMSIKGSFTNFDFSTVWKMLSAPMLRSLLHLNDAYSHGQNDAYDGDNNDAYENGDNDIYNSRLNRVY